MQVRIMETTPDVNMLEFAAHALQSVLQAHTRVPDALPDGSTRVELAGSSRGGGGGADAISGLYAYLPSDIQHIVRPYLTSK